MMSGKLPQITLPADGRQTCLASSVKRRSSKLRAGIFQEGIEALERLKT
jgi:hypothetical protein